MEDLDHKWICEECGLNLTRRWNLARHLIEVHGYYNESADEESYRCLWLRAKYVAERLHGALEGVTIK